MIGSITAPSCRCRALFFGSPGNLEVWVFFQVMADESHLVCLSQLMWLKILLWKWKMTRIREKLSLNTRRWGTHFETLGLSRSKNVLFYTNATSCMIPRFFFFKESYLTFGIRYSTLEIEMSLGKFRAMQINLRSTTFLYTFVTFLLTVPNILQPLPPPPPPPSLPCVAEAWDLKRDVKNEKGLG